MGSVLAPPTKGVWHEQHAATVTIALRPFGVGGPYPGMAQIEKKIKKYQKGLTKTIRYAQPPDSPECSGALRVEVASRRDPPVVIHPSVHAQAKDPRRNGGLLGYRLPEDFLVAERL